MIKTYYYWVARALTKLEKYKWINWVIQGPDPLKIIAAFLLFLPFICIYLITEQLPISDHIKWLIQILTLVAIVGGSIVALYKHFKR